MLKKILAMPTERLGKASRFAVLQIKLWVHCARLLRKNRAGQQAASLSYHTIFGIVPLAIVVLLIFQLFPAYQDKGERVKELIYKQLHLSTIESFDSANPQAKIKLTQHIDNIVDSYFTQVNKGTIAIISVAIVIWAATGLLSTIEKAFNNIWHVARGRSFLHQIINYWALLTLGPLLLGVAIYIAAEYAVIGQLEKTVWAHITPGVLGYIVAVVCFFFLYFVVPNAKVNAKSAIWGAAMAALVWSLAKWGFKLYVTKYIPYQQVYGAMGLIPLAVLWIYITWWIVLFGLQLTFTTQHLESLDAAEIAAARRREEYFIAGDFTVINIAREIAAAFEANHAPVEAGVIGSKLNLPPELCEKVLNQLIAGGIVIKTSEPKTGFVPAKDPANIKLSDIAEVIATVEFGQSLAIQQGRLQQITQSQRDALSKYSLKEILGEDWK